MPSHETTRERVRRALWRAPAGGLTRGELALLLIDVDDDEVTLALGRETAAGHVITSERDGLIRYHPCRTATNEPPPPRSELGRLAAGLGLPFREVDSPPGSAPWEQPR